MKEKEEEDDDDVDNDNDNEIVENEKEEAVVEEEEEKNVKKNVKQNRRQEYLGIRLSSSHFNRFGTHFIILPSHHFIWAYVVYFAIQQITWLSALFNEATTISFFSFSFDSFSFFFFLI